MARNSDIKAINEEVDDIFSMIDRDLQKDLDAAKILWERTEALVKNYSYVIGDR